MNLFTVVLYAALAFEDPSGECYVRGYVYQESQTEYTFSRSTDDQCWVKHSVADNKMVLFHKYRWVMIIFPNNLKGHVNFWYKWGNDKAFIDTQPVKIEWGYSLQG
jgi:hypothetical protein